MRVYIFIFLFTFSNFILAQKNIDSTDTIVSNIEAKMIKSNISDYFIVKHITHGQVQLINTKDPNNCNGKGYLFQMYVFWNDAKYSWIKKYDNCGYFSSIKLDNSKLINYFKKNIKQLKTDEVKRYTIKPDSFSNGKKYSFTSMKSHSPLRYFWFYKDSVNFKNHFDKYDLTSEDGLININCEPNNNLTLVKLNALSEEIIDEFEEKKKFNRVNK